MAMSTTCDQLDVIGAGEKCHDTQLQSDSQVSPKEKRIKGEVKGKNYL